MSFVKLFPLLLVSCLTSGAFATDCSAIKSIKLENLKTDIGSDKYYFYETTHFYESCSFINFLPINDKEDNNGTMILTRGTESYLHCILTPEANDQITMYCQESGALFHLKVAHFNRGNSFCMMQCSNLDQTKFDFWHCWGKEDSDDKTVRKLRQALGVSSYQYVKIYHPQEECN